MTRMRVAAVAVLLLLLTSCAPRFTVYIGVKERMNTSGITLLSLDTIKVADYQQKRVRYALTRDVGPIERLFMAGKIKKMKKKVDKLGL
jgi:hypothetical protein